MNYHNIFYFYIFFCVNLMFLSIYMYTSYKYDSSIHVYFYSSNVMYEPHSTQAEKSTSRHTICLTDSDYDYILE